MERPDDAALRVHVETFAVVRRLLPVAILGSALLGPIFVLEPSVAMWCSVGLFTASLFVLRILNGLPLYPAHTFGLEYRFEDRPFEEGRRRCVGCETITDEGVHRRYARQIVVLGVPIHTLAWGSNDFCRPCFEADPSEGGAADADATRTDRAASDRDGATAAEGNAPDASEARRKRDERGGQGDRSPPTSVVRPDGPGTEVARRLDLTDETTALEVRRAFDGEAVR